jgi:hypothetical protein
VRAALSALLLLGCAGRPALLDTLRVLPREASLGAEALRLDVDVTNPNDRVVALQAVDWTLTAEDVPIVRGRLDLAEPIPARGRRQLALSVPRPVPLPAGALRLEGLFHFGGNGDAVAAPFSQAVRSTSKQEY